MKGNFGKAFKKYIERESGKIEREYDKTVKEYIKKAVMVLDGKKVMIQKGGCRTCCFSLERYDKVGRYRGRACMAQFDCNQITRKFHGTYHFIKIEGGV